MCEDGNYSRTRQKNISSEGIERPRNMAALSRSSRYQWQKWKKGQNKLKIIATVQSREIYILSHKSWLGTGETQVSWQLPAPPVQMWWAIGPGFSQQPQQDTQKGGVHFGLVQPALEPSGNYNLILDFNIQPEIWKMFCFCRWWKHGTLASWQNYKVAFMSHY